MEESARLLYREWFVYLRFPGHEHVKIIDGVPEGWSKVPLSTLCQDIRESAKPSDVDPDKPYIGLEHIPRRSISLGEWGFASDVESNKFRFQEGDILFGKIRPYFHKVGIAFTKGIASSDAIVIRPNSQKFYAYCLFLLSSDEFVALASKTVKEGSKMPRADWKYLSKRLVLRPAPMLMEAFGNIAEPIVSSLKNLTLQCRQLSAARDILLPRLMSGEVAV